jgi:DNA primase
MQSLLTKITVSTAHPEGRQQLVTLAQPYIMRATALYQYLLLELLAAQVNLPVWRLERQMGLKTGYTPASQGGLAAKSRASHQRNHGASSVGKSSMSLAKYLVRILLIKPQWAGQLGLVLSDLLPETKNQDARMLWALIRCYQAEPSQQAQLLAEFTSYYASQLEYIESQLLPDTDAELSAMFENMAIRLADELEKALLKRQVHQGDALDHLQQFLTERKK